MRAAHCAVESITLDREVMRLRDSLVPEYSRMIYNGFWYSPEMKYLQNIMDLAQDRVWGTARLKLYKGNCQVIGRKSERSLYQPSFATFEEDDVYRQDEAGGFIRLPGLRLRIEALVAKSSTAADQGIEARSARQTRRSGKGETVPQFRNSSTKSDGANFYFPLL